jgi:hypothetical protein
LLEVPHWEQRFSELLEARRPLYESASAVVDIFDENIEDAARHLHEAILRLEASDGIG